MRLIRISRETRDCPNGIEYLFMLFKTDILFILLGVWFSYLPVTWSKLDNIFRFYFHFHMKENQILYLEQEYEVFVSWNWGKVFTNISNKKIFTYKGTSSSVLRSGVKSTKKYMYISPDLSSYQYCANLDTCICSHPTLLFRWYLLMEENIFICED